MKLLRATLVVLTALSAACGQETPPAAESAPSGPRSAAQADASQPLVVFLGDSISAGLHLARDEAFPAVLEESLASAGVPFRLVNAGVSGDTTAGGLRRLDWLLRQEPDVVVLELGGNDGLRGVPLASIEENLRSILTRVREAGAAALLLGVVLPPNYGADYTGSFEMLYERLAEEQGVPFVPFFMRGVGGVLDKNLPDGLHPTAEGHRILADNVRPALERMLKEL